MATLNIGMKVNRAISAATTVNANAYAMVTYIPSYTAGSVINLVIEYYPEPITRYFGPGQSIPSSFVTTNPHQIGNPGSNIVQTFNTTWSLASGVELINTI